MRELAADAEPVLVEALARVIAESRTQRVPLEALRVAAVERDSSMADGGRRRLAAALGELEAQGLLTFLKNDAAWTAGALPRLPRRVRRSSPGPASDAGPAGPIVVPAGLPVDVRERAAGLRLTPAEVKVLHDVARWLAERGAERPVVPLRERSLQVFGHEKRIDGLRRGRLFAHGVLDLALLRAEAVPAPFVTTWVPGMPGGEPLCLVAENHHTWMSLVRAARASVERHHGVHVGYGAGNQFATGVQGVALLDPAVRAVHYFGDLDARGLEIPTLAAIFATAERLPPVVPALGLYRRLLRSLVRQNTKAVVDPDTSHRLTVWLGGELAMAASAVLAAGVRVPQEAVGTEVLTGTSPSDWL